MAKDEIGLAPIIRSANPKKKISSNQVERIGNFLLKLYAVQQKQ